MRTVSAVALCLLPSLGLAYHPGTNITRGIYLNPAPLMSTGHWTAFGEGFSFTEESAHSGRASIECVHPGPGVEGVGAAQDVKVGQIAPAPLRISGWSKAEGVVGADRAWNYSVYADVRCADGSSIYMQIATFSGGTHDWEYAETVVEPKAPVTTVALYVFLRQATGRVWFDDIFLGPVDGPNLVRNPGFEPEDRVDVAARDAMLHTLQDLGVNALHIYLSGSPGYWQGSNGQGNATVWDFLKLMRERGTGVWVTTGGPETPGFADADDPNFPQYACVNGPWGEAWVKTLGLAAAYDFAGISLVPDEYNWLYHSLRDAYSKHSDPRVAEFYQKLPAMCDCPVCRELYRTKFGAEMPTLPLDTVFPQQSQAYRDYLRLRYDSTTEWLRRGAQAVHGANPRIRADSLLCVSPICHDDWWGPGIAWDRLGETGIDFPTTDPYIQLHNYLGDSTHWYVTETAAHLTAATPKRQCGIVLEASRLYPEYREIDPVEAYGSALSAVCHGAKELAWWYYTNLTGESGVTGRPEVYYACLKGLYGLLAQADTWLGGLHPYQPVALLYSRASDDWWRFYSQPEPTAFLQPPVRDARHANVAQKEVLYYLFRRGVPTALHYLESVTAEQLRGYQAIVVPFPLAISDQQAALLQQLARSGKRTVVVSQNGPLDDFGALRERPALSGMVQGAEGPNGRRFGRGRVWFLRDDFGYRLVAHGDNQKRTRAERIQPDPIAAEPAAAFDRILRAACGHEPWVLEQLPSADLEATALTNAQGDLVVLTTNWTDTPQRCRIRLPRVGGSTLYGFRLGPRGHWARDSVGLELRAEEYVGDVDLGPQEACLWRMPVR
ncbi:MAG: hypothetical protein HPY69_00860 [Armatimonadetes bacterium]|nr:hypothetical protein [Armatimonadota bacterium]